ncbi:uncharacterized protein LOC110029867 isoform X4 [Phalaenopsis equestris]|uniref:uncharacterized protein LOC110029867 isoform X4 n=1 Tax=Phalaenopsis equestris TaxID=78828 RepID=UPI0009E307E8|nr:uncharacterized protein LOC110029867 isoform X4 [Phalaenopsis equestris]
MAATNFCRLATTNSPTSFIGKAPRRLRKKFDKKRSLRFCWIPNCHDLETPILIFILIVLKKKIAFKQSRSIMSPHKINALFWGPKRTAEQWELNPSLGTFTLTGSPQEAVSATERRSLLLHVSVVSSISDISSKEWDACAIDAAGPEKLNPFLAHAFLSSLEESKCAVKETGWLPQHVVAQDEVNNILGVVPVYLKSHSYGEFVFDHSWADAYYRYGVRYYPKLQSCIPFTPVTGQRIMVRNAWYKDQVFGILVQALKDLTEKFQLSSLHVTFPSKSEWTQMKTFGFLQRIGMQYHWKNRNYKKWGRAFLTRDFFHNMGEKMGDSVLLIVAEKDEELVAGALNLVGGDTLFGRLWGCLPRAYFPNLHFEACYYQAIEAAIELNLNKVEAGAQGEHKIQRGYLPVTTYSCHYILDDGFRNAIADFLVRETDQVKLVMKSLNESGPFKEGID